MLEELINRLGLARLGVNNDAPNTLIFGLSFFFVEEID